MPTIGSETYRSSEPPESVTKETTVSESFEIPEAVIGEDWPVQLVLTGLNPGTAPVPGPDQLVVVSGTGFNESSVINWNGGDETTNFVNETEVTTLVKPSTVQAPLPFTLPVYVRNEDLQSNVLSFTFTEAETKAAKKAAPEEKHAKHGHHKKH